MNEREIFQSAIDIPDLSERQAFLDRACGADAALREQVERLIHAHSEASGFLQTPAAAQLSPGADVGGDVTTMLPRGSTAPLADSSDEATSLEFLEPSTKPGALGRLGHYEVMEVLGRGAFGIVLKAFDEKLHRMVAIKVMSPELAATSPPRKRFTREAQHSAKVRHDNIVAIYDVEEQPLPYLVMEYIPGGTLQERLDQKGPLGLHDILWIGQQIASGLAAAHAQGLIHRDIKPANILIEGGVEERVKITDFGLARATDDASLTQSGLIAGTPMYMSPEQAKGQPLDHRTDQFSLGSVLYTMASGRPPFRAPTTIAVLKRVCDDTPRPIPEVIPEIPQWLCDIIAKLQAKEPEDRFSSAKQVADLLGQHLAHMREPATVPKPAGVTPVASKLDVSPGSARNSARRWSPAAIALTLLCVLLAVPLVGGLLLAIAIAIPAYQAAQSRATQGTLIIQSDEPFVTALVDDRRMPLPGKEEIELKLRAGVHTVTFFKDGQQVDTRQVQIAAGQNHVARWPDTPGTVIAGGSLPNVWMGLFNGFDLTGWQPNPHWKIENGVLVSRVPAEAKTTPKMLVTERKDYRDFHARIVAKLNQGGDSGFFFRFGEQGDRAIQVQMAPAPTQAGGLLRSAQTVAPGTVMIQPETWFTLEVIAIGPRIVTLIDGEIAVRWNDPTRDIVFGPVALESGFPGTELQVRSVEIKSVPHLSRMSEFPQLAELFDGATPQPWQSLFNGHDLTGWKTHPQQPGNWQVENGTIVGTGNLSHLFTERDDFVDFEFRGEVRLNENGNSGVFLRTPFALTDDNPTMRSPTGYELQLIEGNYIDSKRQYLSGGLIPIATPVSSNLIHARQWYKFRVKADGDQFDVWIDDVHTVSVKDPTSQRYSGSHLALQVWTPETRAEFRNLEARLLRINVATASKTPPSARAPFDAKQAALYQDAWAGYLGVPAEYTHPLGMKFRLIPPGEFLMGSTEDEINKLSRELEQAGATDFDKFVAKFSGPPHKVRITQPFYFGMHEVTVANFRKFAEETKYLSTMEQLGVKRFHWTSSIAEPDPDHRAVLGVSWDDAEAFCRWLSAKEQITANLPSEAQWEYACRAGTTTLWSFGDDPSQLSNYAVFAQPSFWPAEIVGSKRPNPFGLFDMHGNADEWCRDWHDSGFYARSPVEDPVMLDNPGDKNSGRVARGGTALSVPWWTRSTTRPWDFPATPNNPKGFRVVLAVDDVRAALAKLPPATTTESAASALQPENAQQN